MKFETQILFKQTLESSKSRIKEVKLGLNELESFDSYFNLFDIPTFNIEFLTITST